jgi:hypothetical protein
MIFKGKMIPGEGIHQAGRRIPDSLDRLVTQSLRQTFGAPLEAPDFLRQKGKGFWLKASDWERPLGLG